MPSSRKLSLYEYWLPYFRSRESAEAKATCKQGIEEDLCHNQGRAVKTVSCSQRSQELLWDVWPIAYHFSVSCRFACPGATHNNALRHGSGCAASPSMFGQRAAYITLIGNSPSGVSQRRRPPRKPLAVTVALSKPFRNNVGMNTQSHDLLQSALALPESDRAEFAASLIRSLDTQPDEDADAAWAAEIQRRVESIDNGEVELIPWDDVMREMRDRKNG